MSTFKKINTKIFYKSGPELTVDNIYWKNYNVSVLVKEFGPVDYIDFSPVDPHIFAVTCSCRVQIYNTVTKLVSKNLNKFKKIAYGGTFRKDGQLLCVGGEEAVVKLFNINTKSPLRVFTGHSAAVHRTFFTSDGMRIVSFSDDNSSIIWDIPSEKKLTRFLDHSDYVRSGAVSPVCSDIYISGGYDKIVNMYDTRTNRKVLSINHDAPVESVMFLPGGGVFLSAGGTEIRVWDCLANGRLLAKICQHHKTVTCLQTVCHGRRILSGSLDRHVKVYDSGTYKTVQTLNYPNSILSLGISVNNHTIATGMVDGMISVKQKMEKYDRKSINYKKNLNPHAGFTILHSSNVDNYVPEVAKDIIGKHDICLRKFQYSKALNHVTTNYITNKYPHVTVALLQELIRRQGLTQALAGRDGKSLTNILKFIIRYIGNIKFGRTLLQVVDAFLDIYEDKLEELCLESQVMIKLLEKKIKEEKELILSLIEIQGIFEIVLSVSETITSPIKPHNILPSLSAQKKIVLNVS